MRTVLSHGALCTLALLAFAPAWANDGDIILSFSPDGNQCQVDIGCGESRLLYVYALLSGASEHGITGVEYGTLIGPDGGPDPGWSFEETFAPSANISLGVGAFLPEDTNAVIPRQNRGRGVNVAWQECQTGNGLSRVLIETVEVTNTGCSTGELHIVVGGHDRAANAFFQCPLFVLCDRPLYTELCIGSNFSTCRNPDPPYAYNATCSTSGEAVINPASGPGLCRPTAVQPNSWSSVKSLYRD
jgi:hypothetical protein